MSDARSFITPKYDLNLTSETLAIRRDNILLRIYPKQLKFQLDRISDDSIDETIVDREYKQIQRTATFKKTVFGVFGYIKLKTVSYLILIEEASIVGQILKGLVYRVEKLMFIPLNIKGDMKIDINDQQYIDMIKHVQKEKSFYFSYDMDLTKNMQATFQDIQNF